MPRLKSAAVRKKFIDEPVVVLGRSGSRAAPSSAVATSAAGTGLLAGNTPLRGAALGRRCRCGPRHRLLADDLRQNARAGSAKIPGIALSLKPALDLGAVLLVKSGCSCLVVISPLVDPVLELQALHQHRLLNLLLPLLVVVGSHFLRRHHGEAVLLLALLSRYLRRIGTARLLLPLQVLLKPARWLAVLQLALGPLGPLPPPLRLGFPPMATGGITPGGYIIPPLPFFFFVAIAFGIGAGFISIGRVAFSAISPFDFFDFAKVKLLAAVFRQVR